MQSLKCLLTVGVAVCALSVRGGDTDAQAKAREALEKKLNEMQGQPAAQPAPAKTVTPPQASPKPSPAKQTAAPANVAPTVPPSGLNAPPAADAAAIEKAREAMREKMSTLQPAATEVAPPAPAPKVTVPPPAEPPPAPAVAPPPVTPPPPVAATAAAAAASAVSTPAPPPPPAVPEMPPSSDPEAIAKAREALRQKMNELQAGQPTPPQPTPAPQPPSIPPAPAVPAAPAPPVAATAIQPPSTPDLTAPPEADPAAIAKAREAVRLRMQTMPAETAAPSNTGLNFPALPSPALPISDAKQQRLQELLQQYRADLISPEQYQVARAKILAEP